MALEKDEAELLGQVKTHMEYTRQDVAEIKQLIKDNDKNQREHVGNLYEKNRENENKIQKTNSRIDKHETRFNTIKAMIVAVGALLTWLFGFKD